MLFQTKFDIYVFIAGGLIVPDGSVSVLTWFIIYLRFYYDDWVDATARGLIVSPALK